MHDVYPQQRNETWLLDRIGTAIALREKGFDVDFEDWDRLPDESVLEIITHLLNGSETDIREVVKETSE